MESTEFDRWVKSHNSAFPGLWNWFTDNPGALESWRECLADVSFGDAREATRQMNRGEYESPPFGEHARTVRRLARQLSYEAELANRKSLPMGADGPRFFCRYCRDSGIVVIANVYVPSNGGKPPIAAFLSGVTAILPVCGVFCVCKRGLGRSPQFDERKQFLIQQGIATDEDSFREWWEQGACKNRVEAFDNWNRGEDFQP